MYKQPTTAKISIGENELQASYCTIVQYVEDSPGMATVRYSYWDSEDNNLNTDMWLSTEILSNMALLFRRAVAGTITESQRNILDENIFLSPEGLASISR